MPNTAIDVKKSTPAPAAGGPWHSFRGEMDRLFDRFSGAFGMPDGVNAGKITADLGKGLLTITLPKNADARKPAQKIEVKTAA